MSEFLGEGSQQKNGEDDLGSPRASKEEMAPSATRQSTGDGHVPRVINDLQ